MFFFIFQPKISYFLLLVVGESEEHPEYFAYDAV